MLRSFSKVVVPSGQPEEPSVPPPPPAATDRSSSEASTSDNAAAPQSLGWLQGPESRMLQKLRVEDDQWEQAVDERSGELCWKSKMTGDVSNLGESKPGPYGRNAGGVEPNMPNYSPRMGRLDLDAPTKPKGPEPSIVALYNNPLGWFLLALACVGILQQIIFKEAVPQA
eukprot:gene8025-1255_t